MSDRDDRASLNLALAALGRSGDWGVDVDRTLSLPERWFLSIEGPAVYANFEIVSSRVIDAILGLPAFGGADPVAEIEVGRYGENRVDFRQDDEFADRCFVVINCGSECTVWLTLAGEDAFHVVNALRQVREELREGGYLLD